VRFPLDFPRFSAQISGPGVFGFYQGPAEVPVHPPNPRRHPAPMTWSGDRTIFLSSKNSAPPRHLRMEEFFSWIHWTRGAEGVPGASAEEVSSLLYGVDPFISQYFRTSTPRSAGKDSERAELSTVFCVIFRSKQKVD